jgi:hypothetical protein
MLHVKIVENDLELETGCLSLGVFLFISGWWNFSFLQKLNSTQNSCKLTSSTNNNIQLRTRTEELENLFHFLHFALATHFTCF